MSLQPSDPAADAFERLRLEVALLRRAMAGLSASADPIDYSPTLAGLSEAITALDERLQDLGMRPALALQPEHLAALLRQAAAQVLTRPLAELEQDRTLLRQAAQAMAADAGSRRLPGQTHKTLATAAALGALGGAVLWGTLLGPVARALPASWQAPERLAAATLSLPRSAAGEHLLRTGAPASWERLQLARALDAREADALRKCLRTTAASNRSQSCSVRLNRRVQAVW